MIEFGFAASLTVQNVMLHIFYVFANLLFNGGLERDVKIIRQKL